jgi:hypothetical protein
LVSISTLALSIPPDLLGVRTRRLMSLTSNLDGSGPCGAHATPRSVSWPVQDGWALERPS